MNATVTPIAADVGLYAFDGGVYRVRVPTHGKGRYAEGLVIDGGAFRTGRWVTVAGLVTRLRDAPRLTVEGAVSLGQVLGVCVACGQRLTLSHAKAGIHPACRRVVERGVNREVS